MAYENQVEFFNLNNDGDSSIIRLLHTGVKSIEMSVVHTIDVAGKKKTVGCCSNGCPICLNGGKPYERIYVHLMDYADGKEKVWSRTPTILSQFSELESSWGDLSNVVFKITRKGKEFPKYDILILPPNNYAKPDASLIDKKIGYRYYMHRTVDELNTFYATGTMPAHESKPYVSKEEYMRQRNASNPQQSAQTSCANNSQVQKAQSVPTYAPVNQTVARPVVATTADADDVFIDPFESAKPRRV